MLGGDKIVALHEDLDQVISKITITKIQIEDSVGSANPL
jgi:hypothetical protein